MKSAYELAMERLAEEEPEVTLTDAQKQALAATDKKFASKIAEREIFLKQQLANTEDTESRQAIEKQLVNERLRLQDECEQKKETIRKG